MKKIFVAAMCIMMISATTLMIPTAGYIHAEETAAPAQMSTQQRQALISELMATIVKLQAQLKELQRGEAKSKYCYGETMKITWNQSEVVGDTVDILLTTPQTTLRLDTVRSSKGVYEWKINRDHNTTTGVRGFANIETGDLYKIRLQTLNGQSPSSNMSGLFEIASCGGKKKRGQG
jgi:hypothetical protein